MKCEFKNSTNSIISKFMTMILQVIHCKKSLITLFDGGIGRFYPKFYKTLADKTLFFKYVGYHCSLLLSFEVANHVITYLTETKFTDYVFPLDEVLVAQFTSKEKATIGYWRGYVFGRPMFIVVFTSKNLDSQFQSTISNVC